MEEIGTIDTMDEYLLFIEKKQDKGVLDIGLLDVDGQHPVGGGEDDGGDGEAESQGSCNSNFL